MTFELMSTIRRPSTGELFVVTMTPDRLRRWADGIPLYVLHPVGAPEGKGSAAPAYMIDSEFVLYAPPPFKPLG